MLTDNLQKAAKPRDQVVTLGAISNYGGEDLLDAVTPYFTVPDEKVRAAAYGSLRHMEDSRAVEMLTTHYESEESPKVRAAAAKTRSQMIPSAAGVA
ncbi:MAG: hypothetical protein DRR19_17090 [Candidatus Parabeggiatoa sp. nov. 1]|nr:MAG: hypothetical protein DRR19_17090 [Gammaproteobacteria bacterium]